MTCKFNKFLLQMCQKKIFNGTKTFIKSLGDQIFGFSSTKKYFGSMLLTRSVSCLKTTSKLVSLRNCHVESSVSRSSK